MNFCKMLNMLELDITVEIRILEIPKWHMAQNQLGTTAKDYSIFFFLVGSVLWNINQCSLFNDKSCLFIYIKYTCFIGWLYFMAYQPLKVI